MPGAGQAGATPLLLCVTAFALFFFPSNMVIKTIGAAGTVPIILSCLLLALWVCSWMWGLHNPIPLRHPGRLALGFLILGVGASYAAMHGGWSGDVDATGTAAADRWLILVAASAGLVLVTSECIRSMGDVMRLLRWLLAGAAFSCLVGVVQFAFRLDPMQWVHLLMPGFTDNGGATPFQARGNLVRVAGSTFHSIEFAVISGMLLPVSIWRALYDPRGSRVWHWAQTALLGFGVASSVSRSGMLAAVVALAVSIPFLPRVARRRVLVALPFVLLVLFMTIPGFVTTLTGALTADTSDPSIATRVNNYPRVARLIDAHPLFGLGPGNYQPANALQILDNQYLNGVVTLGLVGLSGLVIYLVLPGIAGIHAARHAISPALKCLAGAVAAGLCVAAVCSATFDSLSFPVFALLYPLLVGLGGAVWRMVRDEEDAFARGLGSPSIGIGD
ncbi:O-antigen ligase family protein [Microbacterium sp. 10M-3C3]|uniref:O-antigen ligase family protein n=1 Tax=Microbacterium sp. 10M-3C3 TaxID=2483401 RepID=UPI0013DE78AD|nr:O-antigen ligase family protein [Microbacterium sp. 10M-3C3]